MRILHTIETRGPGGAEILIVNIAKYLSDNGYSIHGLFIKDGWIREKFMDSGYETCYYPLSKSYDISFPYTIYKFIKKHKINLIHAHEFHNSLYASIIGLLTGVQTICTFHGKNYHCDSFRNRMIMKFISKASKMVTVSEDIKKQICSLANIKPSAINVIENGVFIPERIDKGYLKAELNLPDNSILIGSVGRLSKVKGHTYLIEAAQKIVDDRPDVYFVISGDGPDKDTLFNQIKRAGLSDKFFLLGNRNDISNILASLDIFALPSLSEGTSLALLEAMCFELPIIATRVGNNKAILKKKRGGVLIDPASVPDLVEGIFMMVDNNMHTKKFKENAVFVKKHYSFKIMMQKYVKLYHT